MGVTKNEGVQTPCYKEASFTYEDLTSGEFNASIDLPGNAEVVDGAMVITEAFNSGTSDTGTVGDTADDDRYKSGINMQTLGQTRIVPTGSVCNSATKRQFGFKWTGVDTAPTAGGGRVWCLYIVKGCADHIQR